MTIALDCNDLLTPCLIVDIPALAANQRNAANHLASRGKNLRAHYKVHRSPDLALWQIENGCTGLTVARLDEAKALIDVGISNLLVANPFSGLPKCRYAASLAGGSDAITVALDNLQTAFTLDAETSRLGKTISYVIDVDLGMQRSGVSDISEALELFRQLRACSSLKFMGVMGYEGHVGSERESAEKAGRVKQSLQQLKDTADALRQEGAEVNIVSSGGTGAFQINAEFAGITELRMGGYLFADEGFRNIDSPFQEAAYVLTRVVYQRSLRVVLDCGTKGIIQKGIPPRAIDDPTLKIERFNAEHAICLNMGAHTYHVGDLVRVSVPFADGTFNQYSKIYGVRNGTVEKVWKRQNGL
jgi:3-hydroxy-D-aspartate aldolase